MCKLSGASRVNTKHRVINVSKPNELWEVDLIGRLRSDGKSNKFIFVAIDHYTKWIESAILESKDMKSTADAIEKLIIKKHGIPERILSDNGLEFKNEAVLSLQKKYNFKWDFNSPGHHETMGAVKRVNQTLLNKLKKLCKYGEKPWEFYLEKASYAVNILFHRALKTSPMIFKYGCVPDLYIDKTYGVTKRTKSRGASKNVRDMAFEEYSKKNISKGKILASGDFKIGYSVAVYKKTLGNKMGNSWTPGFKISQHVVPDAFIVTNGTCALRLNKAHIKKL